MSIFTVGSYGFAPVPAASRTPVAYPIFTFRWLAVHALVVRGTEECFRGNALVGAFR